MEQTYFRWRKEFGGLKLDQARRMKELETENARLRRAVADLTLDKLTYSQGAGVSERRVCRVLGHHPSTHRQVPPGATKPRRPRTTSRGRANMAATAIAG
jgi:hypothetical protein